MYDDDFLETPLCIIEGELNAIEERRYTHFGKSDRTKKLADDEDDIEIPF